MEKLPSQPSSGFKSLADVSFPADYPSEEYFTHGNFVTGAEKQGLRQLIQQGASERTVDAYLTQHTALWDIFFPHTGNHGIWVIPKQQLKTKIGHSSRGLIPDYLIGTKNSEGFQYWVVELKGIVESLLITNHANEVYFSPEANKGICQLIEYVDYCSKYQSKLRDEFKLKDFREPNGILVIGTEQEFEGNPIKQEFKAAWNRLSPKLEIRTYHSILRRLD